MVDFNCCRIDATDENPTLCRLVNDDNKHPNCVMKLLEVDKSPHLCLFAVEDLRAGTELRYDYGEGDYHWRNLVRSRFLFQFEADTDEITSHAVTKLSPRATKSP